MSGMDEDTDDVVRIFEKARALSRDPATAKECVALYEAAARAGLAAAQLNLGAICEAGRCGVARDFTRAAELYAAAASEGLSAAEYNLGRLCELGQGVPMDKRKAVDLYERASRQGDGDAMVNLATMVAAGEGVERDSARAIQLYSEAAELGHPLAMRALGLAHLNGAGGLRVDPERAEQLLRRAAQAGDGYAWYQLARLLWHSAARRSRIEALRCAARAARTTGGWREFVTTLKPWTVRLLRFLRLAD